MTAPLAVPTGSSIFEFPPNFPNGQVADTWIGYFQGLNDAINSSPAISGGVSPGDLSNQINATYGAGMVGYGSGLTYASGTVGKGLTDLAASMVGFAGSITTETNARIAGDSAITTNLATTGTGKGADLVGFDPDATYSSGTTGKAITDLVSSGRTANTPAHSITKTTSDSTLPNITMLLKNTQDSGSGTDYDNEVHLRLQAGTTTDHRAYINFADHTGTDKWVTGRNASSVWILYNSETIHRFWFEPTTGVFNTGNSYINAAGTGKIRFNWHPSDTTGTGGIEVWSGGTTGVNTLWFDVQTGTGVTKVYNTTQASNGGGAFQCAGGGYFAKNVVLGGNLQARASGSYVTTNLYIDDAAATTRQFFFTSAGVQRWVLQTNASAESGSDAGSNFSILAKTDAGGSIDAPIDIVRASAGTVTIGGTTNRLTQITGTAGLQVDGKAKMQTKQLTGKARASNGATTSYTVAAGVGYAYIVTSAASMATTFPTGSNALDGLEITVCFSAAVASATWISSGCTFVGAPAAIVANTPYRFIYHNATAEWLPR